MAYANDVFVSYSREDEHWAAQLETDLKAKNPALTIFRDTERLKAGDIWDEKLSTNLINSQHLVVVWSDNAKMSGWVNREIAFFLADAKNALDRKFLCLVLQGENRAYAATQMLTALQENKAYEEKPQSLSVPIKQVWNDEIGRLDAVIRTNDARIVIPWTAIALTQDEFAKLDGKGNMYGRTSRTLDESINDLGVGPNGRSKLQQYYGVERFDWKPFLGNESIKELVEKFLDQINKTTEQIAGVQFKSQWVDFLAKGKTNAAAQELTGDLVLVVVDPISLYADSVQVLLSMLKSCFERESVLLVTLPPVASAAPYSSLRQLVKDGLAPFLDFYFDPPVPINRNAPWCGLNLGDAVDVRRLVQWKISGHPQFCSSRPLHPAISVGGSTL
jgi:hypothetical protein